MKKWKQFLRSYFGFNQKETNGFIILIGIVLGVILITICVSQFYPEPQLTTEEDKKILAQLLSSTNTQSKSIPAIALDETSYPLPDKYFDPNTIKEQELAKMLGKKLAKTIVNYRNKGGRFVEKEDLLKIYGMHPTIYESIQPWIRIGVNDNKQKKEIDNTVRSFDINKADTLALQKLKGIGSVLAARIIKFRDKLGGFYDKAQYEEIYGLQPEVINELKNRTFIDKQFQPIKMSLNTTSDEALLSHPYIGKKFGYPILKYKKSKGKLDAIEELKGIKGISEEAYFKMLPYISL